MKYDCCNKQLLLTLNYAAFIKPVSLFTTKMPVFMSMNEVTPFILIKAFHFSVNFELKLTGLHSDARVVW